MCIKKICVFTSTHLETDIRIYEKQIRSLLKNDFEISYYTNKGYRNIDQAFIKNLKSVDHPHIEVHYNKNFNEDRRLRRVLRSLFFFTFLPKDCQIYHFHDPDLLPTGLVLKLLGKKVIYDVHENYRDSILDKDYLPKLSRKILSYLVSSFETFCCRKFDLVVCATMEIQKRFLVSKAANTIVINNYAFKAEFNKLVKKRTVKESRIIYAGAITEKRGISKLIQSLDFIDKDLPVKLILAGQIDPPSYLNILKSLNGWSRVEYIGILSREALAEELSKSLAGIVLFLPLKNHINAQPNKIFEYMSAGIPVLSSDFPLWREIIEDDKCGICVNPENIEQIASGIRFLITHPAEAEIMGKNGKIKVMEKYNWETEEEKLISGYKSLIEKVKNV